jgi:hypothetical protein
MIQRIQSIYLLLAATAALLTFFLPFAHFLSDGVKLSEYALFGFFNVQSDVTESAGPYGFPAWIFSLLVVVIPLIALFLYKNRPLQLRIARLGFLLNLGFLVYLFFAVDSIYRENYGEEVEVLYHAGFYMPVIAIAFLFLAVRGIKKDEALVKSLDRIR